MPTGNYLCEVTVLKNTCYVPTNKSTGTLNVYPIRFVVSEEQGKIISFYPHP
jgi:hypothetical protein